MIRNVSGPFLAAALVLAGGIGQANAAFVNFFDKSKFLEATGATKATAPYLGGYGNVITSGTITFSQGLNAATIWTNKDWTPLLPGFDLAVSGYESINVKPESPVFALGFDFVEPNNGIDSTFKVTISYKGADIGNFEFNAPNNVAYFVGIQSDIAFDYMKVVEVVGGIEDEFYGQFYTSTTQPSSTVPEPASVALLGLGLTGLTVAARRRRA